MNEQSYSLTEAVLEKTTPLRWSEESGALEVDAKALPDEGARYAKLWLLLSGTLFCIGLLLGDLLFATSATAKLGTVVIGLAGLASLAASAVITLLRRRCSSGRARAASSPCR